MKPNTNFRVSAKPGTTSAEALATRDVDAWLSDWLQRTPSEPAMNESFARGEISSAILRPTAGALSPKTFRRYKVGFQIAYGGTAAVHLGLMEGPSGLRRPVAMKRIRSGIPKEHELRVALSGEAWLGAHIRHPNVVPILDLVEADGELLLVMEYVVGETLARLQRSARHMPTEIVIAIMIDVLRGLHAAHIARGSADERLDIVHRDVSPQNVLVGVDGVARIMDFGMARAVSTEPTQPGYVKGKVGYLAPEQITSEPVDARTDVFAAGIVIWEALAGRRLFEEGGAVSGMLRFLTGRIPPASKFNPEVPKQLDALIAKALMPSPDRRFATAEAFADALEDAVRPASSSEVARYLKRHVGLAIAMQRTLLRGLQRQDAPASMGTAQGESNLELYDDTIGLSESGVRDAFDPEKFLKASRISPVLEREETTHFYVCHSEPPPIEARKTGAHERSKNKPLSLHARAWLAAIFLCVSTVSGLAIESWTRARPAPAAGLRAMVASALPSEASKQRATPPAVTAIASGAAPAAVKKSTFTSKAKAKAKAKAKVSRAHGKRRAAPSKP